MSYQLLLLSLVSVVMSCDYFFSSFVHTSNDKRASQAPEVNGWNPPMLPGFFSCTPVRIEPGYKATTTEGCLRSVDGMVGWNTGMTFDPKIAPQVHYMTRS